MSDYYSDTSQNARPIELSMTYLVTPDMANFYGNMHGGDLLRLVDQVAYACAARYSGTYMVTLVVDRVLFKHPIKVGNLVHFMAQINFTGRTSLEVGLKVVAEDIIAQSVLHTNSCYVTMVAINKEGQTIPVPPYKPQTPEAERRWMDAMKRREFRLGQKAG
jgi:acyl-CoA hydrolase